MTNTGTITKTWLEARELIKQKQWEQAEDKLDLGLVILSKASLDGLKDKDLLDGVKMEVWYERMWISIEKYIWPRRPDYELNWKIK